MPDLGFEEQTNVLIEEEAPIAAAQLAAADQDAQAPEAEETEAPQQDATASEAVRTKAPASGTQKVKAK